MLEKAAFILKSIAHPTRIQLIRILHDEGPLSVGALGEKLSCEQSLLSHHLINLKTRGLLSSKKEGTQVLYSLREKELIHVITCIEKCNCNL